MRNHREILKDGITRDNRIKIIKPYHIMLTRNIIQNRRLNLSSIHIIISIFEVTLNTISCFKKPKARNENDEYLKQIYPLPALQPFLVRIISCVLLSISLVVTFFSRNRKLNSFSEFAAMLLFSSIDWLIIHLMYR